MRAKAIIAAVVMILALLVSMGGAVLAAPAPPDTTIDSIPEHFKSLTQITGTATDDVAVTGVEVQIYCVNSARYWNGTSWIIADTWIGATAVNPPWGDISEPWKITTTTTPDLPTWTDGYTYYIYAKAYDGSDWGSPDTESFTCDITDPYTVIDDIPDYVSTLTEITGTATDTSPGKLAGVEVRIKRDSDNKYWNSTSWQTSEIWIDATASDGIWDERSEDWKITTATSPRLPTTWEDGVTYSIRARATDKAGNVGSYDGESFTYETTEPDTTIDAISDYVNTLTEITGTAIDTDGKLAGVELLIQRDSDDRYWNGTSWTSTVTWIDATASDGAFDEASEDWKITTTTSPALPTTWGGGETYNIKARAEDAAENVDPSPATERFTYDATKPDTIITDIPPSVANLTEITGTATDTDGKLAGVELLIQRDSDDKYWNGTSWQTSEIWIDATASDGAFDEASEDWKITTATSPALPTTWGGGETYNIKARAEDAAENVDPSPATVDVTIGRGGLVWWAWLLIGLGGLTPILLIGWIIWHRVRVRG